ncbi:MAG: Sir2 family NAD-dependent protein deacetylase [Syntrophales bacterium]|jgi:NAD-dependent deacetylase
MGIYDLEGEIIQAADLIVHTRNVVVFTGAGVSTESGIPDFRSPGGIWTRFDPEDFTIQKFLSSPETRKKQWQILLEGGLFANAQPNKAHLAVALLEEVGKLNCIITQNVDNLHQKAGNSPEKVYELHGNMRWLKCMSCDARYPVGDIVDRFRAKEEVPDCERCHGILKPDVVFFGELLPEWTLKNATAHATRCELMIVIGSSLVVYPAAYMPMYAKESGAKLVIINNTPTSCDDVADVVIHHSAGLVMERIMENVRRRL